MKDRKMIEDIMHEYRIVLVYEDCTDGSAEYARYSFENSMCSKYHLTREELWEVVDNELGRKSTK